MATVVTPYTLVDGNTLVPDSFNRNIYSATPGEGIVSEPNGGIGTGNYDASFKIQAEHLQAEELAMPKWEFNTETCDFIENAFSSNSEARFTAIPGLGIRFPVYYGGVTLYQWSVFVSPHRYFIDEAQNDIKPSILMKAFYDGTAISHTNRAVPCTIFYDNVTPSTKPDFRENRSCLSFDMAHLVTSVSKGYHEFSVRIYLEQTNNSFTIERTINGADDDYLHKIKCRLTVGIRNIRALHLLEEA